MKRLALLAALVTLFAAAARAEAPASVRGRVSIGVAGVALADAGPIVVYLEAVAAPKPKAAPGVEIRQHLARFEPAFTVVPVGAPVRMPNQDTIFHNVFSYSRPNDFDLGMYGAGEARTVRFREPGPVRIYCSIHERMNGLIFVTPSALYTMPSAGGDYRITGVPPGRYLLRVWSERLPVWTRKLELRAGQGADVEVRLLALGG
jgi:plastocyanin